MARHLRGPRWQRPALMALAVTLAVVGLVARPGERQVLVQPVVAGSPARPAPARPVGVEAPASRAHARVEEPIGEEGAQVGGTLDAGSPAGAGPLAPDVVVALDRPEIAPALSSPPVTHAHVTDGAGSVAGPTPADVAVGSEVAVGSSDGVEGLEPGARYWFGPRGLEKVAVSMEAQR